MSKILQAYKKKGATSSEISDRLQRAGSLQLFPQPHVSQQEEFSRLSLRMLSLKNEDNGTIIAMASSASGEGSSFVSFNMATFLGLVYDQKVAWIDGNTLSPQEQLQDQEGLSFTDLLREPVLSSELPCVPSQVTLIPGGKNLAKERALFAGSNYTSLLDSLASRFDFVIIDLPPVLVSQDAALVAQKTDGLLLVVAHRKLKREIIDSGIRSLRAVGVNILGAVLNRREFDLPGFLHKWI